LCVDRIYNEELQQHERVPACVAACPTSARHFGDLADPQSNVSQLVAQRGGVDLMPEQGCKPTNKYLPPRRRQSAQPQRAAGATSPATTVGFLGWLDQLLSD